MFLGSCQSLLRVCKAAFDERDENIWGFLLEIFFYFLHFVWTNFKTFSAFYWNFSCGIFKTAFYVPSRNYRWKIFFFPKTSGLFAIKKWKFRKFFSTAMSKLQFRSPEDRFWNFSGKTWNYLSLSDNNWKTSALSRNHYRLRCQKCTVSVQQIVLTVFFPWNFILFLDFPAILSNKSVFE